MKKEKFSEMREKIAERIPKREVIFQNYHTDNLPATLFDALDHVMKGAKTSKYVSLTLGKGSTEKKTFSFGHCPNYLNPPPPP